MSSPWGEGYDARAVEMHRFSASPVDARIRTFLASGEGVSGEGDSYALLTFARRSVLGVLRGDDAASLEEARAAIEAVDDDATDFRDVIVTRQLVAWADGEREASGAGMWVPIETPDGPALAVDTAPSGYSAGAALVATALRLSEVVERDAYRIAGLTVTDQLPAVWLAGEGHEAAARIRGGLSLDGVAMADPENQQFTVFLVEAANAADAARMAAAAGPARGHEALGVAREHVACVAVARSFVHGVASLEQPGALERFREPFERALVA